MSIPTPPKQPLHKSPHKTAWEALKYLISYLISVFLYALKTIANWLYRIAPITFVMAGFVSACFLVYAFATERKSETRVYVVQVPAPTPVAAPTPVQEPVKEKPVKPKPKKKATPTASTAPTPPPANVQEYIERYAALAQAEMRKYGVPASISLAQGIWESDSGKSKLARNNNNHFGIKCFARNCRKGHCTNHTDDSHKDFFRNYPNAWQCWRDHSIMVTTGRYAKLKKHGKDYKKWAWGLQNAGYATDRTYAEKLIKTVELYNLTKYDK